MALIELQTQQREPAEDDGIPAARARRPGGRVAAFCELVGAVTAYVMTGVLLLLWH
jgi:hypothetical protein